MLGSTFAPQSMPSMPQTPEGMAATMDFNKQQMLAQALQKDSMAGKSGGMAGRVYVPAGIADGVGGMAEAFAGKSIQDDANKKFLEANQQYQTNLAQQGAGGGQ